MRCKLIKQHFHNSSWKDKRRDMNGLERSLALELLLGLDHSAFVLVSTKHIFINRIRLKQIVAETVTSFYTCISWQLRLESVGKKLGSTNLP